MKAVHFRPDLNVTQREQELKKLCTSETEDNFFRTLTDSDVDKEKHIYAEKGGDLKDAKLEAKAAADSHKATVQAIEKEMDERLERIQTRKRKVYDKLYGVPNFSIGLMEFFDRFGEMISSRKLTPDETTGQLFNNDGDVMNEPAAAKGLPFNGDIETESSGAEDIEWEDVTDATTTEQTGAQEDAEDAQAAKDKEDEADKKAPKKPRKNAKKENTGTNTETD